MTQAAFSINKDYEAILIALARFHYLTATQVTRLFHHGLRDEDRWSQRHLKKLEDAEYVLRLRALPPKPTGQPRHVFALDWKGRRYVKGLGIPVEPYFRPSEEKKAAFNNMFMPHTLAAIDVLISATCLCRDYDVSCPRMLSERSLKRGALRVEVPPGPKTISHAKRHVAVIPDGWFELQVRNNPGVSVALELDRGTEAKGAWRDKVAALAFWAIGPYKEAFEASNLTVVVVCSDTQRRDTLADWTLAELTDRRMRNLADIFLFGAQDPVTTPPGEFFFGQCWRSAASTDLISVLDPPLESGVVPLRA